MYARPTCHKKISTDVLIIIFSESLFSLIIMCFLILFFTSDMICKRGVSGRDELVSCAVGWIDSLMEGMDL